MQKSTLRELEQRLGYTFRKPELIIEALTHRSHFHEQGDSPHNERLEFLGDSVLNLCVTQALINGFTEVEEGRLSKLRSQLVSEKALTELALTLKLGDIIRLGKGEELSGGRKREALLADTLEAVLGAVFLDGGFAGAQKVVGKLIPVQGDILKQLQLDYKSRLQEMCQQLGLGAPAYHCITTKGPDHERSFVMGLFLGETEIMRAEGRTKKLATQSAAKLCLETATSDKKLLLLLKEKGLHVKESNKHAKKSQTTLSRVPVRKAQAQKVHTENAL